MEQDLSFLQTLKNGIPLDPMPELPEPGSDDGVPRAPIRLTHLNAKETKLAVANALRYFPTEHHAKLAPEFAEELKTRGHIYMERFRPRYTMKAYPIDKYPAKTVQARAIQVMIMNNLDRDVAQFPYDLITYGGNGSVLSNWAQYHLLMKYLSEMDEDQTIAMYSGHPMGLFPSHPEAPRVVITNGMVIPNYSSREDYDKNYALGNTIYGQMTAGSYCYIGSQGIVHGTTITLLNACRKFLGTSDMSGKVFLTAGLGGMSGAQPKAGDICGCITVVAEVSREALEKRHKQGWVKEISEDPKEVVQKVKQYKAEKKNTSIAYLGNVVDLWEAFADEEEHIVDLGSDQTSCHNPFNGGYYPCQLSFEEANKMMAEDSTKFKELVQESLRRQVSAINKVVAKGMHFWDYGNSFLLEASRASADIMDPDTESGFKYLSYVEAIMGDIFSLGFGPFRWICTSADEEDLKKTDKIAEEVILELLNDVPDPVKGQYEDNLKWIQQADENKLVIGSQARILYADCQGRAEIARRFNQKIQDGTLKGAVVLSRDHHDVSGTDSPFRETANVTDGSKFLADMAIQNVIGDSFRGATWVSIHNGGGVGWGEVMNGGFGLVLDGTEQAEKRSQMMLQWDVNNGVSRRAWSYNEYAKLNIKRQMDLNPRLKVTLPEVADPELIEKVCKGL